MTGADGASKGFGFVNYAEADSARRACETMNDTLQEGAELEPLREGETDAKPRRLFVGRAQKRRERQHMLRDVYESQKQ